MDHAVYLYKQGEYNTPKIYEQLNKCPIFNRIKPGMKILIKPNLVCHKQMTKPDWDYLITHPAVIEAVLRIVLDKLNGKGSVVIADAPIGFADFEKIKRIINADKLINIAKKQGVALQIIDLRDEAWVTISGIVVKVKRVAGDPLGKSFVTLKEDESEFQSYHPTQPYYGASENMNETTEAHSGGVHKYSVSKSVIESDLFINLPKMKVHKKAGITCSLKNLVGINTYKNFLPHYTVGTAVQGGDQTPDNSVVSRFETSSINKVKSIIKKYRFLSGFAIIGKWIVQLLRGSSKEIIRAGAWHGNNTIWRMILDLNKVLFYANSDGTLRSDSISNKKPYITVVDGIWGGENDGPMSPDKVCSNVLVCGDNPAIVDRVCARVMGYDWSKIPSIQKAFEIKKYPLLDSDSSNITIITAEGNYSEEDLPQDYIVRFKPSLGWQDYL